MSTAKKRPQLERDELRQLSWLLGNALVLCALSSLIYFDVSAWLMLLCGGGLVPIVTWKPRLVARIPAWIHRLAFPSIVAFVVFDIYAHGEPLASMVRLDVLLLVYRTLHYRRRRDDLQIIVLGLFLVVVAGVVTASMAFAVQVVGYVGGALLLLFVLALLGKTGEERPFHGYLPPWTQRSWGALFVRVRQTCDWRVFLLGGAMFASFVALSGILFLAIPRFQLESGLAMDRLMSKGSNTGFSDTLRFTDVTDIQKDDTVVLRIETSDRERAPASLYWRMVVMDEYSAGVFRMSAELKKRAFGQARAFSRIDGPDFERRENAQFWTFYLEPGAGRYLALAGGFRQLVFAEPKTCRWSPMLRLVALEREQAAMTAYRVEGMSTGPRLRESRRDVSRIDTLAPLSISTGLTGADEELLRQAVRDIGGGRSLSAAEFAEAAMLWLAGRHGYSLKTELPAGGNDPLVRWVLSKQPGHCELFAGGFVLLARVAGYPARIVAGFMGGAWNDDYLVVRNSDAHAWCEIRTEDGSWLRVDPTNDGPRLLSSRGGSISDLTNVVKMQHGWSARLDRLRMLWYRRVVNFDRSEQQHLIATLKNSAEGAGVALRTWMNGAVVQLREWFLHPWSSGRMGRMAGLSVGLLLLVYYGFEYGRLWWGVVRWRRDAKADPVRLAAGRWLQRWNRAALPTENRVRLELLRIRYGRRESWPEIARTFREARQELRRRR